LAAGCFTLLLLTRRFEPHKSCAVQAKQKREALFPLELATKALSVKLQAAEASVDADRVHILNAIVGAEPDAEPPAEHDQYARMNAMLAGRFAAGMLRVVVARGKPLDPFLAAIKASRATSLVLDLSKMIKFTGPQLKLLTAALPVEVEELDLQLAGSKAASEDALITELVKRMVGFPNLRWFDFDCFTPKHAPLLMKVKQLELIPAAVWPSGKARLAALAGRTGLKRIDLSGMSADQASLAAEALEASSASLTELIVINSPGCMKAIGEAAMTALSRGSLSNLVALKCDDFVISKETTSLDWSGSKNQSGGLATAQLLACAVKRHTSLTSLTYAAAPRKRSLNPDFGTRCGCFLTVDLD